jgi:hypothetical protein
MLGFGKAIDLGSQCLRFSASDAGGQGTRQGFPSARGTRPVTEPLSVCPRLSSGKLRYTIEVKNFGCHHRAFSWKENTIKLAGSRNLAQHSEIIGQRFLAAASIDSWCYFLNIWNYEGSRNGVVPKAKPVQQLPDNSSWLGSDEGAYPRIIKAVRNYEEYKICCESESRQYSRHRVCATD